MQASTAQTATGSTGEAVTPAEMTDDYVIRVVDGASALSASDWNGLLQAQRDSTPFMRHEFLAALEASGSACEATGWRPAFVTLWRQEQGHERLQAACPLYLKRHSYGEYVFDWAWARAYREHGLAYFPKAVVAVPFTPVPGPRLLARDAAARAALVKALVGRCQEWTVSSLHLLFVSEDDRQACQAGGLLLRETVQFHWTNPTPADTGSAAAADGGLAGFDAFLGTLSQDKRKKIRQERRKVAEAGVRFRTAEGSAITPADWAFFYQCYAQTYREHGNPPYLTTGFFEQIARELPQAWVMFIAEREGRPMACSLVACDREAGVAWGRYWGALERVDCLHFEACYYQPLQWCIAHGLQRFEGGAQGEHKMARALMPVRTHSAHWLAHPGFADAVERFLAQEGEGVQAYLEHLEARSPFRQAGVSPSSP
jgi:predicted N-acyltransferase